MTLHPEIWHVGAGELTIRILLSLIVGGLIGLEREMGDHPAGFRTHILVCLGSTLVMLLSIYGFSDFVNEPNVRVDPARLAAQVISGIGFLGAGTIMRTGTSVSGLTTAASLWVVAALGLAIGAGFYYGSLLTGVLVVVCLLFLNKWEMSFTKKRRHAALTIVFSGLAPGLKSINGLVEKSDAVIRHIKLETDQEADEGADLHQVSMQLKIRKQYKLTALVEELDAVPGVKRIDLRWQES